MKRSHLALLLGVVVVLASTVYFGRAELFSTKPAAPKDGLKPAPDFVLKTFAGKDVRLSDWKDEAVVVHFWASWCPPCVPEVPELLAAAKRLPKDQNGRPIHWLLVSEDQTWEKAHSIVKEETLPENVVVVLDPEAKVSDLFGSYQFPETYFLTRDHGIASKWIGAQEWTGKWGDDAIKGIESASRFGQLPRAGE